MSTLNWIWSAVYLGAFGFVVCFISSFYFLPTNMRQHPWRKFFTLLLYFGLGTAIGIIPISTSADQTFRIDAAIACFLMMAMVPIGLLIGSLYKNYLEGRRNRLSVSEEER